MPATGDPASARRHGVRGKPVSSAILYAAIVAIWACVLVPRWLRRPHEQSSDQESVYETYDSGEADMAGTADPGSEPYAADMATQGEQDPVAYRNPVAWEEPPVPGRPEGVAETTYSVTASYSAEVTYSAEETADEAGPDAHYDAPGPDGDAPYHYHVSHDVPADGWQQDPADGWGQGPADGWGQGPADGWQQDPADGWQQPGVPLPSPGPSPHVVQARRRTLTMVLLITVAVIGAAFIGLTPWWTTLPPLVMLGLYVLLLREAARADVEHAHRWAEAQARAAQAARRAELARERARQAEVASQPQQTAEIITLSRRTDDQLYDQYADAEIRAVGD